MESAPCRIKGERATTTAEFAGYGSRFTGVVCKTMRRLVLLIVAGLTATQLVAAQSPTASVETVLAGVRSYLTDYFARAQSIVADETVTIQPIRSDLMPESAMARVLKNELRISWEPDPTGGIQDVTVLRTLVSVNGRQPKPKDKDKCFDPAAISPESLAELFLSDETSYLRYKLLKPKKLRGRLTTIIEVRDTRRGPSTTVLSEDEECTSSSKPGISGWRVWIDPNDYVVHRIEEFMTGLLDAEIPPSKKFRTEGRSIVYERADDTIDYQLVKFSDPEEQIMLPRTRTRVQTARGSAGGNVRTSFSYKNYRRFMTGIRIVQ